LTEEWGLIFPLYRDTLISILPKDKIIIAFETRINDFSAFVIEGMQKKGVNGKTFYHAEVLLIKSLKLIAKINFSSEDILFIHFVYFNHLKA
jgi:hypothetical protein